MSSHLHDLPSSPQLCLLCLFSRQIPDISEVFSFSVQPILKHPANYRVILKIRHSCQLLSFMSSMSLCAVLMPPSLLNVSPQIISHCPDYFQCQLMFLKVYFFLSPTSAKALSLNVSLMSLHVLHRSSLCPSMRFLSCARVKQPWVQPGRDRTDCEDMRTALSVRTWSIITGRQLHFHSDLSPVRHRPPGTARLTFTTRFNKSSFCKSFTMTQCLKAVCKRRWQPLHSALSYRLQADRQAGSRSTDLRLPPLSSGLLCRRDARECPVGLGGFSGDGSCCYPTLYSV